MEHLIPTFAKVNIGIKHEIPKLKVKVTYVFMQTEIQNKHDQKRKIKKDMRDIKFKLKSSLSLILYNTLLQQMKSTVKGRVKPKAMATRHSNKLINLRNRISTYNKNISLTQLKKSQFIACHLTL